MNPFHASLAVRTDFSTGESSLQVGQLVERAVELGLTTLAVTDTMTLSAMPVLFEKAKKAGIKPIIGCTLRVVTNPLEKLKDKDQGGYRLKVYVKTEEGLKSLFKLVSLGLREDHFYYNPRVSLDEVTGTLADCIVTTGDVHSLWHHPEAESIAGQLLARYRGDFFVELPALNTPLYDRLNERAAAWASEQGADLLVTRPVFYKSPDDAGSADVLRAITTNDQVSSPWVAKPFVRDMAPMGSVQFTEEIQALRARLSVPVSLRDAMLGAKRLIESCVYEFKKMPPSLPKMAESEFGELTRQLAAGWAKRFARPVWGHKPAPEEYPTYKERLSFELGTIKKMGFSGYFLLVQEIVNWSKENGIAVGPGRGSVGGSLVAYLLGITDIDPIRFGLLFERFINPDRIDLPDADLDFLSSRRQEIIDYLSNKYGQDYVCGIVNFSTLGPASALRDSARVHGLQPFEYACSKQMEKEHGVSIPLAESAKTVPDIDKFRIEHPVIWDHALRLEGANRALGQHAAGVVVAAEPVVGRGVVSTRSGRPIVQWDKSQVENFGLIKIDVLGLTTLDVIDATLRYIKERHGKTIHPLDLPLDDDKTLQAFSRGETTAVFQFESAGMKKLLREMAEGGTLTFDDLCAATALFRPGPLDAGLCDRYVQVKQGHTTPFYEHPALEECLGDTFGVIVYQEQVMKITRVLCGFTPGESDGVRKAIGKKDAEKMAEFETKFVEGAVAAGMAELSARSLWETILGFAGYAFNKSHSSAYTLLSWVTMWLKVHYAEEFYAGALSVVADEERQASLIADAQSRNIQVLPPCVQVSSERIEILAERLYAPFQAVKGISAKTAAAIRELREAAGGAFTWAAEKVIERRRKVEGKFVKVAETIPAGVAEFDPDRQKELTGKSRVNAAVIERLGKVGAFHALAGGLPPMHPDRLRDRLEYMPGFTVEVVKASRGLTPDHLAKIKITQLVEETRTCEGCSLKGKPHPVIRMGDAPKFMLVLDAPGWQDERDGKLLAGDTGEVIKAGLKGIGLKVSDGYYTALVKSAKPKGQKVLTNEQINGCSGYLAREIEIMKPQVIIAMGGNAIRYFAPSIKGSPAELAGKVIYRSDLDATVIFGLNPATLFFNPGNLTLVEAVFNRLNECLT